MSTNFGDAKRTLTTGDLVISVNEIFDRLQTKVDPNTLEQLLRDILAGRRYQVRPGELITAELINQILAELESLQVRVTRLEATGSSTGTSPLPTPVITEVRPSEVQIRHQVEVLGRDFPDPVDEGTADVDGARILRYISTSPTRLVFEIPPTISPLPKDVDVTVRNGGRSGKSRIRVIPERVIPEGRIVIADKTPELGTILVGRPFTFVFELDSQTTIPEDYRLEVRYTDAVGTATLADWSRGTTLTLLTGRAVPIPMTIARLSPVRVNVNITIPAGATSVNMALRAVSVNNDAALTTASTSLPIRVGSSQTVNDHRIQFVIVDLGPFANARKATIDGLQGVEVAFRNAEDLAVNAHFDVAGTYAYSVLIESNEAGIWVPGATVPPSSIESAGGQQDISVNLRLTASRDPSGAHPEKRFMVIKAARTDTDATGRFESTLRFPIQGFAP